MSPRPKSISDAELLAGVGRAVSRVGPVELTLADVANEVGVAPATLSQRFGSKREMLLAFAAQASESGPFLAELRAECTTALATIRAYAECTAGMAPTPEELANHLTFLVMDLTDPDFHQHALAQARAIQGELEELVNEGIGVGELRPTDATRLARLIQQMVHGALVTWAILREGSAAEYVRSEFDHFIEPYVVKR